VKYSFKNSAKKLVFDSIGFVGAALDSFSILNQGNG
jgi:hypothetical protein